MKEIFTLKLNQGIDVIHDLLSDILSNPVEEMDISGLKDTIATHYLKNLLTEQQRIIHVNNVECCRTVNDTPTKVKS